VDSKHCRFRSERLSELVDEYNASRWPVNVAAGKEVVCSRLNEKVSEVRCMKTRYFTGFGLRGNV
jgi:hypothetical protein